MSALAWGHPDLLQSRLEHINPDHVKPNICFWLMRSWPVLQSDSGFSTASYGITTFMMFLHLTLLLM